MYDFYLDTCLLPVAPKKLQVKVNNANKTVTLINEGEVNILKTAKLTDIEFECEIPQSKYPYAVYKSGFRPAEYFLERFEALKMLGKPFQFIVSRHFPDGKSLYNTNMKVTMESYTITEDSKNGFDLAVTIKLKQWREYGTKTIKLKPDSGSVASGTVQKVRSKGKNSPAPASATLYTVVKGDCLSTIARRLYGNGDWKKIYNANRDKISSPSLIYPGQVLTIPAA